MSAPRLTAAQLGVLHWAAEGEVKPGFGWAVHHSWGGHPTWFVVPQRSFDKCTSLGLLAGGRLTEAGRTALAGHQTQETPHAND